MVKPIKWVWIGLVLFLAGGALLAYVEGTLGTVIGATGLALMIWGWWRGR